MSTKKNEGPDPKKKNVKDTPKEEKKTSGNTTGAKKDELEKITNADRKVTNQDEGITNEEKEVNRNEQRKESKSDVRNQPDKINAPDKHESEETRKKIHKSAPDNDPAGDPDKNMIPE